MVITPGGTIPLNDLTTGANVQQISLAGSPTSVSVGMTGTATNSSPIDSFGLDMYQTATSPAPEPATFGLVGGALLGLGVLGRKKISRQ